MSRIRRIADFGQQVWLDNLSRQLLESGQLKRWIEEDAIAGVTTNPAIFFNAIRNDTHNQAGPYQSDLARLKDTEVDVERRFERLVLPDIQAACDMLRPLYDASNGDKGYVSFEVSPRLANDTAGTLAAAKRLWAEIDRPNAMIKIPATQAGLGAIRAAIAAGININVTLMFSPKHLTDVFDAYLGGLTDRYEAGLPVERIRSVASFFISRVDTLADKLLPDNAAELRGKIAVASAKAAYATWLVTFGGERFAALKAAGARPQSCLWASTGTKNPAYSDLLYVEELIGPDTVNTVPDATLVAFADHGEPNETLTKDLDEAYRHLSEFKNLGFDLNRLGDELQQAGLRLFEEAFYQLLEQLS